MKTDDPRLLAINVLQAVLDNGDSLTAALSVMPAASKMTDTNRSLCRALSYGVLRWYVRLDFILDQLLQRPLRKKDRDISLLLLIGLYQLSEQRVPDYACVSEAVQVAHRLKKTWAKGLANAVLRNFVRQKEALLLAADKAQHTKVAFPQWLSQSLSRDWEKQADKIMQASNLQAPMTLRVNRQKISVDEYLQQLKEQSILAQKVNGIEGAIQLNQACDVNDLPGFDTGFVSVQDAAAQMAAVLLDAQAGDIVLDACAAPGGKTGHILELTPDIQKLIAIEIDEARGQRIIENLQRIEPDWQACVQLEFADVLNVDRWWDGQAFDRILLDAPCSATGVIRRHPDIKHLRRASDIESVLDLQQSLLKCLWSLLKPGGRLLYATCSVLKSENELQLKRFIESLEKGNAKNGKAVQLLEMAVPYAEVRPYGYQVFPGDNDMDGFYYAALQKLE